MKFYESHDFFFHVRLFHRLLVCSLSLRHCDRFRTYVFVIEFKRLTSAHDFPGLTNCVHNASTGECYIAQFSWIEFCVTSESSLKWGPFKGPILKPMFKRISIYLTLVWCWCWCCFSLVSHDLQPHICIWMMLCRPLFSDHSQIINRILLDFCVAVNACT